MGHNCKHHRALHGTDFIKVLSLICLFCSFTGQGKELFIDYGVGGEGSALHQYFHDVSDGFYVDIGAYDPHFASNTLNLHTQGWSGVNVEPNPKHYQLFLKTRPHDINVNYAIGEENKFLTLSELGGDRSAATN